ncbi:MBG domain-containing protein [Chitinophaga sp. HK235]|uniref:MBG domain-containing protein n=1 Tax=Chitinophaga sp. HK235 TaxID=2952571 RepID=UPI001BA9AF2D|nr:MBG domain-containing protein [Chitinophaga sp. HK235]
MKQPKHPASPEVNSVVKLFRGIGLIILLLSAVLQPVKTNAQVVVTATQGTLGPTTYPTLKAAFDAVNTGTHQGQLNLTITGNTTETATATLNASGTGGANYSDISIKPATGTTPVVSGIINNAPLIKLNGACNISMDGSNGAPGRALMLVNNGIMSPNVLVIGSVGTTPVKNVTVANTTIVNGSLAATAVIAADATVISNPGYFNDIFLYNNDIRRAYTGIYLNSASNTSNSNIRIENNDLNATGTDALRFGGIMALGVNGLTISNNRIGNFDSGNDEFDRGIWLNVGTMNTTVSNNTISGMSYAGPSAYGPIGITISCNTLNAGISITGNTITDLTSNGFFQPMGIFQYSTLSGVTISNNRISSIKNKNMGIAGASGIMLVCNNADAATRVYNNFIWDITSAGYDGFQINHNGNGIVIDKGGGYDIDFNTVALNTNPSSTGAHKAACLLITGNVNTTGSINIRNNIFANLQTIGDANSRLAVANRASTGAAVFGTIDYNDYYSESGNLGATTASLVTSLAALQTSLGGNTHSINVKPVFAGANDLHLTTANISIDNKGTPLAGITDDIDGELRSTTAPDPGADEVVICPAVTITTQPTAQTVCENKTTSFSVAGTNANIFQWQVNTGSGFTDVQDDANYSGATTAVLTLTGIPAGFDGYNYRCVVNSKTGCPAINTNEVMLSVNKKKTAVENITICNSQLPYTWNGQSITAGGNAIATYTTASLLNGCDSTTTLNLTVNMGAAVTSQPASSTITFGDNTTFSVTASGSGTIVYQWQEDTGSGFVNLADGGVYSGTAYTILTLTNPPASMNNYRYRCVVTDNCATTTSTAVVLTVNKKPQVLQFSSVTNGGTVIVTYGDPATDGSATTSSGLNVTYVSSNTAVATVAANGQVTILAAGTAVITASQTGNGNYLAAADISFTLQVNRKTVTVTATVQNKTYGDPDPVLTFNVAPALIAGDVFTGTLIRTAGENVGVYTILQGSLALNNNYTLNYNNGNLNILKKDLTIRADDLSRPYNTANPILTMTYNGFVSGDNETAIAIPAIATTATISSPPGTYPIQLTGGAAVNYNLILTNGTLTVENIQLLIIQQPADQEICAGATARFSTSVTVIPSTLAVSYQWQRSGDGVTWRDIPGATMPDYATTGRISQYLRCMVATSGVTSYTNTVYCRILPSPVITATKSNDISCAGNVARLMAAGALQYQWSPATGLSNIDTNNPFAAPAATTTYTVVGTAANGCSGTAAIILLVSPVRYEVPNAFTPNGDGRNDCFGVRYWKDVSRFECSIYNRAGLLVFYSNNPALCWDGGYKGQQLPAGAYVYVIQAVTSCGPITQKGSVLLIR